MRALWKGSISFGLVNIPVALYPATRREELKFRLLRDGDMSPINYKRVAETDGKEVPWEKVVKGYEYEKGKFVILKDEDFKRVDIEATQTVDIIDFVEIEEINPMYFQKPYFLEPQKGGAGAYMLLRDVLRDTGKTGISKVVIRTRQHLAAVRPSGDALVLEIMHFQDELLDSNELKIPEGDKKTGERELQMAKTLVDQMTEKWDPSRYTDDYTSALMKLIDQKIESGGKDVPAPKPRKTGTNVIDLVEVLRRSLDQAGGTKAETASKPASTGKGSKAAKTAKAGKTETPKRSRRKAA